MQRSEGLVFFDAIKSYLRGRRLWLAAAVLALLFVVYGASRNSANELYLTAPVERGIIAKYVKATGVVEPVVTVDVSSQLSGRVADVLVNFNDAVKQGQVIARLDPEAYDAQVGQAKAALKVAQANALLQKETIERARALLASAETALRVEQAQIEVEQTKQAERERDYQRFLKLAQSASIADQEVTHARALRDEGTASMRVLEQQVSLKAEAVEIAKTEIAMAQANLANADAVVEQKQAALNQAEVDRERTEIRAPIDGIVIQRDVNAGQTVAVTLEAKTLFKIAHDLREMQVRGRIDEADVGRLKVGQRATFTVDAYPDKKFDGQILQIRKSPETTQNVVTYTAVISAPNPDLLLLPGMTATLQITVSETAAMLKIPAQALRFKPSGRAGDEQESGAVAAPAPSRKTVWVLDDTGTIKPIQVSLAESDGDSVAISDGNIRAGDKVVVGVATPRSRTGFFGFHLGY
jgi:HlyD family secretion protein